jgi:hypothetical protein
MVHLDTWVVVLFLGVSVLIVAGQVIAFRRLRPEGRTLVTRGRFRETSLPDDTPLHGWAWRPLWIRLERLDAVSLTLLAVTALLFWIGRGDLPPLPPDNFYHMRVVQGIFAIHAIPYWDSWSYAPLGRPHLYPPLYHLLIAAGAWWNRGDIVAGFQSVQALALPFVYGVTWYFARWLFDARRALLALLLIGWDVGFIILSYMSTPSALAAALAMLMVVAFLSRHMVLASLFGALAFYTHMGSPVTILAGLVVFCVWKRVSPVRWVLLVALILLMIAPWYGRVWAFREWFNHPIDSGVYGQFSPAMRALLKLTWLQCINIGIVLACIRVARFTRWRNADNALLLCLILAGLPSLISYGGRFLGTALPFMAMVAAGLFVALLQSPVTMRRMAACVCLALSPTVLLMGTGTRMPPGPVPVSSGWFAPVATASGLLARLDHGEAVGQSPHSAAKLVTGYIEGLGAPQGTVYCNQDRDMALLVGFALNCPTDSGAWEETRPKSSELGLLERYSRIDPNGIYVGPRKGVMPHGATVEKVGEHFVGRWTSPPPKGPEAAARYRVPEELRSRQR